MSRGDPFYHQGSFPPIGAFTFRTWPVPRPHLELGPPAVPRDSPFGLSELHDLAHVLGDQLVGADGLGGEDAKPLVYDR